MLKTTRMRTSSLLLLTLAAASANAAPQRPDVNPFSGNWSGGGRFTSEVGASACEYAGAAEPASVSLLLEPASGPTGGFISFDLPSAGAACPAVKARYRIEDVRVSGNSLNFGDAAGNQWHLTLRDGRLQGMASSSLFSGEVDLNPAAAPPAAPVDASPSPSPSPSSPTGGAGAAPGGTAPSGSAVAAAPVPPKGSFLKGVGGVIAANVVGAGAFVGLNKLLKDNNSTTSTTPACSIRSCVTSGPGDCQCNTNLTNGASCGNTTSGVPYAMACSPPSLPCKSELSCNNFICQDASGNCPF